MRRSEAEGRVILHMDGEFDLFSVPALEAALRECGADERDVVVDMSDVRFIDSSGLRSVLVLQNEWYAKGFSLVWIVAPRGPVTRLIEMMGIADQLDLRASLEEAVRPS